MKKEKNRNDLLTSELINYNPIKNGFNIPTKNYSIRIEDIVPALAGVIGKTALVAAFAMAWAKGLGISNPAFIIENVRLEIIIGSIISILLTALFNPYAAPQGTLAPLVPLVPLMASLGVHPLIMGILVGFIGLLVSKFKFFDKIMDLNGIAARGAVILLFGIMGITSSIDNLLKWTNAKNGSMFSLLILLGIIAYLVLTKLKYKWLMIPTAAAIGILIPAIYSIYPEVVTAPALPIVNPKFWWFDMWGLGWGFTATNFLKALPFAFLAVVMWPTDAIAIKIIQENNYGPKTEKAIFDMNSTFLFVSLRSIIVSFLGGSQTSAIWRSFMIPLSSVRRPIGGSALLLGVFGVVVGLLGFPIDIVVFPPLIGLVLLFGIYIPLVEIGLNTIKTPVHTQIASLSILAGLAVNPIIGWITAILIENLNIIKENNNTLEVSPQKIKMTVFISGITILIYILSVAI